MTGPGQQHRRPGALLGVVGERGVPELASSPNWREATRLYPDIERIRTAPELAMRLSSLGAQADQPGRKPSAWPADAVPAGVDTVRSGHLIPHQDLLDAFVVACGVRPEHLEPWHVALNRVNAATGGIIELRACAIELARAFDRELKIAQRRHSSRTWTRRRAEVQDRRSDPAGINRASVYGQLRGLSKSLAQGLDQIDKHTNLRLDGAYIFDRTLNADDDELPYRGSEDAVELVAALAVIQVDASSVDLSNVDL